LKRITLSLTALAATTALAAGLTATASAASGLVGAGSTLVAPLVQNVFGPDFKSKSGTAVTYGAIGSGGGIAQITARSVDFGASDAPLTAAQASSCTGCVQIPWALSATAVAYNLSGVSSLKLSGPVLAGIYQGSITTWNAPQIKALNTGVTLPATKITPAFRSDGSGDTYAFTNYLSKVSPTWASKVGVGTQVSFPTGTSGKGNAGVAAVINSTPGAIGYVSAYYVRGTGMHPAAIANKAGQYVYAYLPNIKAAAALVKSVPANNQIDITNPSYSKSAPSATRKNQIAAYPISTFTYIIVSKSSPQASVLKQFITMAISPAEQSKGGAFTFAPLPGLVATADTKEVGSL
jgi:phosphate transport system substrate-binding protein